MKRVVVVLTLLLGFSLGLYAKGHWNIPTGSYDCRVSSFNDANWNAIRYLGKKEQYKIGFVLDNKKIIDADGLVYNYINTNVEGTNVFITKNDMYAIFIPKKTKVEDKYGIGGAFKVKGQIRRFYMRCKKVRWRCPVFQDTFFYL